MYISDRREGAASPGVAPNGRRSLRPLPLALAVLVAACTPSVSRSFDSQGITTVVLRAANASDAAVYQGSGPTIRVTGTPRGGARGYHPPDPQWRETPASRWGLDFDAKRYGNVLVISAKNEIHYIHHAYFLESLVITVPAGVSVQRIDRELTGSGAPDLSPPAPALVVARFQPSNDLTWQRR